MGNQTTRREGEPTSDSTEKMTPRHLSTKHDVIPKCHPHTIKTALALDDAAYKSFYAAIEKVLVVKGWVHQRFRSTAQKTVMSDKLVPEVMVNGMLNERFPDTIRRIETKDGRRAFEGMVYKICCNLRRRKPASSATNAAPVTSAATTTDNLQPATPATRLSSTHSTSDTRPAEMPLQLPWAKVIFSRELQDNAPDRRIAICPVFDVVDEWPACANLPAHLISLNYTKFCRSLEREGGYDSRYIRITWKGESGTERNPVVGDTQWRAVMYHLMLEKLPLEFIVECDGS